MKITYTIVDDGEGSVTVTRCVAENGISDSDSSDATKVASLNSTPVGLNSQPWIAFAYGCSV